MPNKTVDALDIHTKRLVLLSADETPLATLDISTIQNANVCAPVKAIVEILCDLGHWHRIQAIPLLPWGE